MRNTAARRIFALLEVLMNGAVHGRSDLARDFRVSQRTIRRDIDVLTDCGFYVEEELLPNLNAPDGADRGAYQLVTIRPAQRIAELRKVAC